MKKVLIIGLCLASLLLCPVFASSSTSGSVEKNSWGLGLNLGTNTGLGVRYGMGDFDLIANIGADIFRLDEFHLSGDVAVDYKVYTIDGGNEYIQFPITVGAGVNTSMKFKDNFEMDMSVVIPVGIEYTFVGVPITIYLRLAPGMKLMKENSVKVSPAFAGYVGALWNF